MNNEQDKPRIRCGIYCLKNTKNGKVLVGKAVDIQAMLNDHKELLKAQAHPNHGLQLDYNESNGQAVKAFTLEEVSAHDKRKFAQACAMYVRKHDSSNPEHGYNFTGDGSWRIRSEMQARSTKKPICDKKTPDELKELHREQFEEVARYSKERSERMKGKRYALGSKRSMEQTEAKSKLMKSERYQITEEQRAARSEWMMGKQNALGSKRTDEQKERQAEGLAENRIIMNELRTKIAEAKQ